jgi:hypothetical protein
MKALILDSGKKRLNLKIKTNSKVLIYIMEIFLNFFEMDLLKIILIKLHKFLKISTGVFVLKCILQ